MKNMKGVLVYADGRTTALDTVNGAEWWVQMGQMASLPSRYFKCADIARLEDATNDPIWVYVEKSEEEYRRRERRRRDPDEVERDVERTLRRLLGGSPSGSDDT